MADGEITRPRDEESTDRKVPHRAGFEPTQFQLDMRDALPGDRAIIAVEQNGALVWVASKKHVPPHVASDITELMQRFVLDYRQNWPGA
jgi:hypothetical protein